MPTLALIVSGLMVAIVGCNRMATNPTTDQSDTRSLTRTHGVTNATNVGDGNATGASGTHSGGTFGSRLPNEAAGTPKNPADDAQSR